MLAWVDLGEAVGDPLPPVLLLLLLFLLQVAHGALPSALVWLQIQPGPLLVDAPEKDHPPLMAQRGLVGLLGVLKLSNPPHPLVGLPILMEDRLLVELKLLNPQLLLAEPRLRPPLDLALRQALALGLPMRQRLRPGLGLLAVLHWQLGLLAVLQLGLLVVLHWQLSLLAVLQLGLLVVLQLGLPAVLHWQLSLLAVEDPLPLGLPKRHPPLSLLAVEDPLPLPPPLAQRQGGVMAKGI